MVFRIIDYRNATAAALTDADEALTMAKATDSSVKAAAVVFEEYVSVVRTGLLVAVLEPQTAVFSIPKAKVGDIIFVHRFGKPTKGAVSLAGGVQIEGTGYVSSAGVVEVYYSIPTITLTLGVALTIPLRLRGFRAS